jgi:hypothetical protein
MPCRTVVQSIDHLVVTAAVATTLQDDNVTSWRLKTGRTRSRDENFLQLNGRSKLWMWTECGSSSSVACVTTNTRAVVVAND